VAIVPIREGVEFRAWSVGAFVYLAMEKGKKTLSIRVSPAEAKRIAQAVNDTARQTSR